MGSGRVGPQQFTSVEDIINPFYISIDSRIETRLEKKNLGGPLKGLRNGTYTSQREEGRLNMPHV
jgi:hypothetical protein